MIQRVPCPETACIFATVEYQDDAEPNVRFYTGGQRDDE